MNQEIKAKWVSALRSGKYRQAKERLQSDSGGFCCLGVLCDLYIKEHPSLAEWHFNPDYTYGSTSIKSSGTFEHIYLPSDVANWAGFPASGDVIVSHDHEDTGLSELNDEGMSFADIAALIEEQL